MRKKHPVCIITLKKPEVIIVAINWARWGEDQPLARQRHPDNTTLAKALFIMENTRYNAICWCEAIVACIKLPLIGDTLAI